MQLRPEQLAAELARRLAPHKRPRRVCVVDALPMRATGKVDRGEGARDGRPRRQQAGE